MPATIATIAIAFLRTVLIMGVGSYSLVAKAAVDGPHKDVPGTVKAAKTKGDACATPKKGVARVVAVRKKGLDPSLFRCATHASGSP